MHLGKELAKFWALLGEMDISENKKLYKNGSALEWRDELRNDRSSHEAVSFRKSKTFSRCLNTVFTWVTRWVEEWGEERSIAKSSKSPVEVFARITLEKRLKIKDVKDCIIVVYLWSIEDPPRYKRKGGKGRIVGEQKSVWTWVFICFIFSIALDAVL